MKMLSLLCTKNLSLVALACLLGVLVGLTLCRFRVGEYFNFMGSIRLDADSNTILDIYTFEQGSYVYRAKYRDPMSFEDYVFVFDPSEVVFDSYAVNYARRDGARNGGMRTDKGVVFPGDVSKRMISLPGSAGAFTRRYTQPSSSRANNFVSAITAQFFYTRGSRSEEAHQDALAKFRTLDTRGQFMVLRNGVFVPVSISTNAYR